MSVIFDGTTRVGEVLAVVVRYCTKDFSIEQRCIALTTAAKHMSGSELGGMLIRLLVKRIGPSALDVTIAGSRDSCATNGAAMRSLKLGALPSLVDIMCFSHTLHNCAKHMDLQGLEKWLSPWFQLIAHAQAARTQWKAQVGQTPKLFSKVRWWSRMECAMQLASFFNELDTYVQKLVAQGIAEASTAALAAILQDQGDRRALQIDLAVVLDASIFFEKTYRLEGDRLELFFVHEDIEAIREKGRLCGEKMASLPNVSALLRQHVQLKVGSPVLDWFGAPYNAYFKGKISRLPTAAQSTYDVTFEDRTIVEYGEQEVVNALDIRGLQEWKRLSTWKRG